MSGRCLGSTIGWRGDEPYGMRTSLADCRPRRPASSSFAAGGPAPLIAVGINTQLAQHAQAQHDMTVPLSISRISLVAHPSAPGSNQNFEPAQSCERATGPPPLNVVPATCRR